MSQPYTHAVHMTNMIEAAQQCRVIARKRVQVQKRGVTYCACIVEAWTAPNGLDCWTVEADLPERARFTVPCAKVRACGDSACACIGASAT